MSEYDDLNRRFTSLEQRFTSLESQVHMEAGLRAAVDTDLSALSLRVKALQQGMQAIADTQSEHTRILGEHTERLTRIETAMGEHGRILGTLIGGQETILALLNRIAPPEAD